MKTTRFQWLAPPLVAVLATSAVAQETQTPASGVTAESTEAAFTAFDSRGYGQGDVPLQRRARAYPAYGGNRPAARQGLLLSLGFGGGSLYLSNEGRSRIGAADFDFRLGYGLSDQFQMFMDLNADQGRTYAGESAGSWSWTMRAQTLLIGDRAGNGLSVNAGLGFGGLTYDTVSGSGGPTGLAAGAGLSFDARITQSCTFSPELFFTWHQIPNGPDYADDVSSTYGLRLNLLWYLH